MDLDVNIGTGWSKLLKYNVKEKICDENDNLIKKTTTYLNTDFELCEPRKLLINLYNTRKQVSISETCSLNEILFFRQETWHSPRDTWRLAENLIITENASKQGYFQHV